MKGKGSLFAVMGPPPEEDEEDFADDAMPTDDEDMPELGAGPFDAYAETVFDVEADPASRADALRQAILTILEERGG